MNTITSIKKVEEILSAIPTKNYWHTNRDWQEEFIYQVLVDRFHDDKVRYPLKTEERSCGSGSPERLKEFCYGKIKGITNHLDYIQNLGCTALWISPIFQNNKHTYHGYAIQNFLDVDYRFGTKEDFIELVEEAHKRDMRVFLDIILNHSGDNWYYAGHEQPEYSNGHRYLFGGWRDKGFPIPIELRNPNYYNRMGRIRDEGNHWDDKIEGRYGDFFKLKDFKNDESPDGLELQEILIKTYCYWIQETDIDGFRLDAVKHIPIRTISRFCTRVREYTKLIGKRDFFLFGEMMAGNDKDLNDYSGPNYTVGDINDEIYYGLDSILDFPLYYELSGVIKAQKSPKNLFDRYNNMWQSELQRGIHGQHLVTFIDNHDLGINKWLPDSKAKKDPQGESKVLVMERLAADTHDRQVIAGIGYLLCAIGTPCIYYGTEQGFSGHTGEEPGGDRLIREAMFDLDHPDRNYLNEKCKIYQSIKKIAEIRKRIPVLRYGRMYFRETGEDTCNFGFVDSVPSTLAFSRILADKEVVIAYNTSTNNERHDYVIVSSELNQKGDKMKFLYGGEGEVKIIQNENETNRSLGKNALFIKLDLKPMQFVILNQTKSNFG